MSGRQKLLIKYGLRFFLTLICMAWLIEEFLREHWVAVLCCAGLFIFAGAGVVT